MPWPHSFSPETSNKKAAGRIPAALVSILSSSLRWYYPVQVRPVGGRVATLSAQFPELPSRNCAPLYSSAARCVNRKIRPARVRPTSHRAPRSCDAPHPAAPYMRKVRQLPHVQGEPLRRCPIAVPLPLRLEAEAFKLFVDHCLESFQRLGPTQEPAINKKRRSPRHPGFDASGIIALDLLLVLAPIDTGLKGGDLESEGFGMLGKIRGRNGVLLVEEEVVEFPKLALLPRTVSGFSSLFRLWMDVHDGKITKCELYLIWIALQHLLEYIDDALAIGALEIRELDNRDRGIGGTLDGSILRTDVDD